jgi:sterol desaturase/sphingolipid hydroxylase (fatty acid hydroxylase superfamily)
MPKFFPYLRYLEFAPLAFVGFALIEALILTITRRQGYNWKGALASLADLATREVVLKTYLRFTLAAPFFYLAYRYRLHPVPLNPWVAFLIVFFGVEFAFYWFHRCTHQIRFMWATHSIHHSPNELNLSAAYRTGITRLLSGDDFFFVPLVWLGFPPQVVFGTLGLSLVCQYWLHTDWIPKLGWLEWVLNTPSHHRVHHAANLDYLDANYGGVVIVFDRLFGTFRGERDDLPCRFGLVKPLSSNNPLAVEFHEWRSMFRDLGRARSLREVFGFLFGPPGWRPVGEESMTTAALRRAAASLPIVVRTAAE